MTWQDGRFAASLRSMLQRSILIAVWLVLGAAAARAEDPGDFAFVQNPGALLPREAAFTEADGRTLRLGDLGARPVILALGYFHCPSLCSLVRDDLFDALSHSGLRSGADYDLLVASIDPAETPADAAGAKADDVSRYGGEADQPGWHFVVGSTEAIDALASAVGFKRRYDAALRQFLHPAGLVVLTPGGRVSGYVLGVGYRAGEIRAAVTLASGGGIARAALPLLLLCFHYDAATGRYSLAVMKVLRLAGIVTVLTMGSVLLLAWRRERRKAT